jgi:phosphohistidine phosphatase
MEIYVVRHGIAIDREDPKSPADPERFLTEDGIKKTKQVAAVVAALSSTPDLLLSSPYVRAMQTAEIFAGALEYPKQKIRRTDKQSSAIFIFGHAPQLEDLIATALGVKHHITSLKKAGVALIELKRVSPPNGQLVWLAPPKLLRRAGK